jgi:hypothetical protein
MARHEFDELADGEHPWVAHARDIMHAGKARAAIDDNQRDEVLQARSPACAACCRHKA